MSKSFLKKLDLIYQCIDKIDDNKNRILIPPFFAWPSLKLLSHAPTRPYAPSINTKRRHFWALSDGIYRIFRFLIKTHKSFVLTMTMKIFLVALVEVSMTQRLNEQHLQAQEEEIGVHHVISGSRNVVILFSHWY